MHCVIKGIKCNLQEQGQNTTTRSTRTMFLITRMGNLENKEREGKRKIMFSSSLTYSLSI